jgi:hypothetical protein
MLTLDKRPCRIGSSINTRSELHGEETVPAMDIPLEGIMLQPNELNALLNEPFAHSALFDEKGTHKEPIFRQFKPFVMKDKFEDATVSIELGLKQELITLQNVKLAKLTLTPMVGGLTELSLQVQCTPDLDLGISTLLAFLNKDADVEITVGKKAADAKDQPQLPLNTFGEGEQSEKPKGKRGRGRPRADLN